MDFMNLNQAAHGDREFGFVLSRLRVSRKIVVGHWQDPAVAARIGSWARAACGWQESRNLKLARFGSNMRRVAVTDGDRLEAQVRLGVAVDGFGVADLETAMANVEPAGDPQADRRVPRPVRDRARARSRRRPSRVAGRGGAHRGRSARLPRGGWVHGLHRHLRGSGRPSPAPRHRRAETDGRWLWVRSRRRLEDGDHGQDHEGDGRRAAMAAPPSWRTTPITSATAGPRSSAPTCSKCARRSPAAGRRVRSIPSRSVGKPIPVRLVFTARTGPAVVAGSDGPRQPVPSGGQRSRAHRAGRTTARLPVARAVWKPLPDFETATSSWLLAGGSHHTCLSLDVDLEVLTDFANMAGSSWP